MKKMIILLLLLIVSVTFAAEYDFTLTVQNQQVSGTDFIFDIYMLRTGTSDIYLGDSDFVLTFNSGNFTSPAATVETAATNLITWYTLDATIVSTDRMVLNITKAPFSNQTQFDDRMQVIDTSANGTLIAQVKISNITNAGGTAGLQWRTADANKTTINRIDNADPWAQHNIDSFGTYTNPGDQTLPVELASFTATSNREGVLLQWATESEINNLGYIVERKLENETTWTTIASYKTHDILKGQGSSTTRQEYSFTDSKVLKDKEYNYRLSDVDKTGSVTVKQSTSVMVTAIVPKTTALMQPYPNPFNPETRIKYDLATDSNVNLFIVDILGRTVATLVNGRVIQAGSYDVTWNGKNDAGLNIASGTYLVVFKTNAVTKVQKVVLLR